MTSDEQPLVECVPNFSEGHDDAKVKSIVEAIQAGDEVHLLDWTMDRDHNRSVVTFVGCPGAVAEAALRGVARAAELIDMNRHQGVHPRIGATDVIPFVPFSGCDLTVCIRIARWTAEEVWRRFQIPTYLYGAAASVGERQNLEWIRRGQFEGLRENVGASRLPDFGSARLHPSAGATAVGARKFLIAYNINLATTDVEIARQIARKVRASGGGLPHVKALGLRLESRNLAQVSMNLTDFESTSLPVVFEAVRREAESLGARILESEIVGLVPRAAMAKTSPESIQLRNFGPDKILENRLARILGRSGKC